MDKVSPKIIILVLNWNGWRDTLSCLESLYACYYPDYQVVLIDNNSTDESLERIREWAKGDKISGQYSGTNPFTNGPLPFIQYDWKTAEQGGVATDEEDLHRNLPVNIPHPLIIIQTGANRGFAGGNNVGLRYARQRGSNYILLLNNDAMLRSQHAITTMIDFMDTHPDAGACGGRLFYPDGSAQSSYGNFPSLPRALAFLFPVYKLLPGALFRNFKRSNVVPDESICEPIPVNYPSGACLMVRTEAIIDIGLLDEQFFMYAEEADWCLRMMKHGWQRYYVPRAEIVHKYAGSFNNSTVKMNRYFLDSLFKYYRKNFTAWSLWIVAAGYAVRALYSIAHWTVAASIKPEPLRLSAQDKVQYWKFSLKLAVSTMKNLLAGEIRQEQEQGYTRSIC